MSGGVDSSVAAWLLKEQGYDVIGVTMQIWQDEDEVDPGRKRRMLRPFVPLMMPEEWRSSLDIPYYVMNFKKEFKANVMDYFVDEYLHGRTPNPCIACNRYVKWEVSAANAALPSARIILPPDIMQESSSLPNGRYAIRRFCDCGKRSDLCTCTI